MKKHIIWTNYDLNYEDWREDLEEEYPDFTEEKIYEIMYEMNDDYLYDERVNLNITLNEDIIIIADLGLWFGRRYGYKELNSNNIKDCLYSEDCDFVTWYVDRYKNLCCTGYPNTFTGWKCSVMVARFNQISRKGFDSPTSNSQV